MFFNEKSATNGGYQVLMTLSVRHPSLRTGERILTTPFADSNGALPFLRLLSWIFKSYCRSDLVWLVSLVAYSSTLLPW